MKPQTHINEDELLERLASAPLVEVSGVVSPTGAGGGKVGREPLWTLRFAFEAWRIAGSELRKNSLTVTRKVTDDELSQFQTSIDPYAVIRIRARVAIDQEPGESHALLEELVGPDDGDADLQQFAGQLQEPVTYHDAVFGVLRLDRRVNWYSTQADWNGGRVTLNVSSKTAGPAEGLKTAHELWKDQTRWDQRVKDYAVLRLLPLRNDGWADEEESPTSAAEFRNRMKLDELTVYPNGTFEFWHNDGGLFWGHAIYIKGNLTDGPTGADTPG